MFSIITSEVEDSGKQMLNAKWIEHGGELVAVIPATECVQMLSNPSWINGIKSEGMRASCEGKALVEQKTYECYTMDDVLPILNYKIKFPKGKFNGMHAYYNICTEPNLGLGFAALCRIACGCNVCKEQLARPWMPCIDMHKQPRYAANRECVLWWSYEGANDWRICKLLLAMVNNEKGVQDLVRCILNAMEARICCLCCRRGRLGQMEQWTMRRWDTMGSIGQASCMLCKQLQSECWV
jgi:hypothetical protein